MRIGVDGYNLAMPHGTGVATYATELVKALKALDLDVDGVFGIGVSRDLAARPAEFFDRYRRLAVPPQRTRRRFRYWYRVRDYARALAPHPMREVPLDGSVRTTVDGIASIPPFDRLLTSARLFEDAIFAFRQTGRFTAIRVPAPPDVMHWTYPLPIRVLGARNVYTLHDLVPLKLPYTTLDDKQSYSRLIAACIRHASAICTVSESSKRDIVERFGIAEDRVINTYQAATLAEVTLGPDAGEDADAIASIFGLARRGYFLFFGAVEPKKNIGRLIEAHLALRSDTPLVIVGARAWQSEAELQLMPGDGARGGSGTFRGPRGQTIMRLDYLSRALLAKLIRGAKAVVFPSLYEGFGLPVLEAMQMGTPVITSNTSSLPEIVGSAGLIVDPYDVDALREAMRRLDVDQALAKSLGAEGRIQAVRFSPESYGERLKTLYRVATSRR